MNVLLILENLELSEELKKDSAIAINGGNYKSGYADVDFNITSSI